MASFGITCCSVFNVWPKTTLLLPVWHRDTKRLGTPGLETVYSVSSLGIGKEDIWLCQAGGGDLGVHFLSSLLFSALTQFLLQFQSCANHSASLPYLPLQALMYNLFLQWPCLHLLMLVSSKREFMFLLWGY